jgi:hypothetical protein
MGQVIFSKLGFVFDDCLFISDARCVISWSPKASGHPEVTACPRQFIMSLEGALINCNCWCTFAGTFLKGSQSNYGHMLMCPDPPS